MLEFIISGFLFTYVGGLFIPILLRFLIVRRPIGKFLAILTVGIVFIVQYLTVVALNPVRKTHIPLFIVAYIGYLILRKSSSKETNKNLDKNDNAHAVRAPKHNHSIKDILLNKKASDFWLYLIGAILLALSTTARGTSSRTLEDILSEQTSLIPTLMNNDFLRLSLIYVFCVSLYFAFMKYKESKMNIVFVFIIIGITFNPFFDFHFGNGFGDILKLATAVLFGYFCYQEYKKLNTSIVN
ncbi:MAG TPA: hypothetical protein P5548_03820 [Candidatus Moranbacteria bacterium]|nr:hypothetical protein [Candidatus Moranbacteria bacterium]